MNEVFLCTPINSEVKTNRKSSKQTPKRHPWRSDFICYFIQIWLLIVVTVCQLRKGFFFLCLCFSQEHLFREEGEKEELKLKTLLLCNLNTSRLRKCTFRSRTHSLSICESDVTAIYFSVTISTAAMQNRFISIQMPAEFLFQNPRCCSYMKQRGLWLLLRQSLQWSHSGGRMLARKERKGDLCSSRANMIGE